MRVLGRLFVGPERMYDRAAKNREEAKQAVMAIFLGQREARATRAERHRGATRCAANAIAEYSDYGRRYTRRSNQVQRSFEDTPTGSVSTLLVRAEPSRGRRVQPAPLQHPSQRPAQRGGPRASCPSAGA